MHRTKWQFLLALFLISLSALSYLAHFLLFKDLHHILIYLVGDIAFVPVEVLLVTLIIHRLLSEREKRSRLEKLNMVIGTYFSETGTPLLFHIARFDKQRDELGKKLVINKDWTKNNFITIKETIRNHPHELAAKKSGLVNIRKFLMGKRDFLLRLLENPNLLEHESFTEHLRAVFHLCDELGNRKNLLLAPQTDIDHLNGDIKRAYRSMINEWLDYMFYLKKDYPYLFSLAVRTNPFDASASPVVK
ncbi:MAG: hypothetical protein JW827_07205 [Spirochaetes bacterium]|nr:hypothetical protein [Spirochaetota bacterium]